MRQRAQRKIQPIGTGSNGGDELIVDGNQWDAVTPGGLQVVCQVTPLPPKITLFGITKTGTVSGLTGSVQNTSSNLQIDQVYKGSATATFVYSASVGGTKIPCGQVTGAIVTFFFSNLEVELAQSFVLNAGGGPPLWKITPSCTNVPVYSWGNIDYLPPFVGSNKTSPAWQVFGLCERVCPALGGLVPWQCVIGFAPFAVTGATGGYCSFHPVCL